MNVLATVQLLEEAIAVYSELKQSGVIDDIAASVEKDKEIIAKLEANQKLTSLVQSMEGFVEQHKP